MKSKQPCERCVIDAKQNGTANGNYNGDCGLHRNQYRSERRGFLWKIT
jgi:hypothetical protein